MSTEVKSDNEVIAEFMGVQVYEDWKEMDAVPIEKLTIWTYRKNLDYDTNWSRLMPVVEKIESLGFQCIIHCDSIVIERTFNRVMKQGQHIAALETSKIKSVYKAVLSFIHWYNSLSK